MSSRSYKKCFSPLLLHLFFQLPEAASPRGCNTCPHSSIWKPFLWAILITVRLHTGNGCWKRLPRALNRKTYATVFERREVRHSGLSVASLKVPVFPCRKINPTGAVLSSSRYGPPLHAGRGTHSIHCKLTPSVLICEDKGKDFMHSHCLKPRYCFAP